MFSDSGTMKITLTVNQVAGAPPTQPMTVTLDEQGGSIGRRDENDWVLPDPERFISGRHALVDFSDGSFHITDLSSNGVFINRSAQPLGKNNRAALQDGDSFTIGDYDIGVAIEKPVSQTLGDEQLRWPGRPLCPHAGCTGRTGPGWGLFRTTGRAAAVTTGHR